jgi:hypothetical protein
MHLKSRLGSEAHRDLSIQMFLSAVAWKLTMLLRRQTHTHHVITLAWHIIISATCVHVLISYPYGVHLLNEAIISDGWRITNLTVHELLSSPMGGSCMTGKARLLKLSTEVCDTDESWPCWTNLLSGPGATLAAHGLTRMTPLTHFAELLRPTLNDLDATISNAVCKITKTEKHASKLCI